MANRVISRTIRGRAPRRSTQWIGSADDTAFDNLAGSTKQLDQSFAFAEPATIVRTRGMLWIKSDQLAASEEPFGALGMMVASDEAVAAGAASLPGPFTEDFSDSWFVWLTWAAHQISVSSSPQAVQWGQFEIDSKAQRKVHDGDTVGVMIETGSAFGCEFLMHFRMLVKLHG